MNGRIGQVSTRRSKPRKIFKLPNQMCSIGITQFIGQSIPARFGVLGNALNGMAEAGNALVGLGTQSKMAFKQALYLPVA